MAIKKSTKKVRVTVFTITGAKIIGKMHVDSSTSSMIRPSDTLRDARGDYLVLTEVEVQPPEYATEDRCVIVRNSSIAWIAVPEDTWAV
jgi:DNA/RNA endonuclease YhcR with UshA esterase domain